MNGNLINQKRSVLAILLMLSWPAITEQLLLTAVNYVDAAMVGTLGATATAAVAVSGSATWLVNGLFNAVGTGFSVQVAHSIGAGDYSRTRRVLRQAVLAVLVLGIGMLAVVSLIARFFPVWMGAGSDILADAQAYCQIWGYSMFFIAASNVLSALLRGMGDTRTPLMLNAMTNLLNVLFNFLFIFPTRSLSLLGRPVVLWGAGLGVAGAALGTTLSLGCGALLLCWSVYHRAEPFKIYLKASYRPDREIIRQAFRLGLPMAMDRVIISSGQLVSTRIITGLGTVALAAHHIGVTAEGLSYLPANGIGFAATTLVGQSMGARRLDLAGRYASLSARVGFCFSAFTGLLLFVFATPLAGVFTPDPEVVGVAALMLRIVAVAQPMFGVAIVLGGALRGAGDARRPFYYNMGGMWLLRIPLALLLVHGFGFGLAGVWIAMAVDLTARGVACAFRLRSGRWRKLPPVPALEGVREGAVGGSSAG